ncbi:TetR/AcrR family transcriptional regulator [Micromonospora echinaurantiaca]|uniref:TetR/AcrR family transcriptional regulator n=1 Tax=Micromonospora echinaurantiaca TaxID=47857 RepID=UPI0037202C41
MSDDQDGAADQREAAVHADRRAAATRPDPGGAVIDAEPGDGPVHAEGQAGRAREVSAHAEGQLGDGCEVPGHIEPGAAAAIVTAARQLAEAEGWPAVTPRRLAERAGVDLGVFYRCFADRDAVLAAVAVRGFAELAAALTAARSAADGPRRAWSAVVSGYLDFAYANPEVYDAMLAHTPDLTLGADRAPVTPAAAFAQLRAAVAPLAAGRDPDTLAELGWSLLHGVVMLTRGGRLRPEAQEQREEMIATRLLEPPVAPAPRRGKVPGRSGGGAL